MKMNHPVTDREVVLGDDEVIVSKTDLKGRIIYANPEFCRISGFTEEELSGKSHNIVRHPDMPPAAFADLWVTLKQGKPWCGVVKNRCKNGDYYWVNAYVAPIEGEGGIVGFTSMRTKPTPAEIRNAERLYREVGNGRSRIRLRAGRAVNCGWATRLSPFHRISSLSPSNQLAVLMTAFVAGLALSDFQGQATLKEAGVGGSLYQRIAMGKDLVADVLPPPANLLEPYLIAQQLLHASTAAVPALIERFHRLRQDFEARHRHWASSLPDGELRTRFSDASYRPAMDFFALAEQQFIPALETQNRQAAMAFLAELERHYGDHRRALDAVVRIAGNENRDLEARALTTIDAAGLRLAIIGIGLAAMVGMLGWMIIRSFRRYGDPRYIADVVRHLAAGNLAIAITAGGEGPGQVMSSITFLQQRLRRALGQILAGVTGVADEARQLVILADGVTEASGRQQQSAASIASAIEQVSYNIRQMAENAAQTEHLAVESGRGCELGAQVIHTAVEHMERIAATVREASQTVLSLGERSEHISSVIQVIREIAAQTNLLALNAAIEAARAGEQGRGFAVVADEVRRLAERTAKATLEIREVIEAIQAGMQAAVTNMQSGVCEVDEGVRLANEAGEAINRIRESSRQVVEMVAGISNALAEQRSASSDIAAYIDRIETMSEENSRAARESAEGTRRIEAMTADLQNAVSRFVV